MTSFESPLREACEGFIGFSVASLVIVHEVSVANSLQSPLLCGQSLEIAVMLGLVMAISPHEGLRAQLRGLSDPSRSLLA